MLRKLTNCCQTSVAAAYGIKTAAERDADFLSMATPIRVSDNFVCGMFLYM